MWFYPKCWNTKRLCTSNSLENKVLEIMLTWKWRRNHHKSINLLLQNDENIFFLLVFCWVVGVFCCVLLWVWFVCLFSGLGFWWLIIIIFKQMVIERYHFKTKGKNLVLTHFCHFKLDNIVKPVLHVVSVNQKSYF